MHKTTHLASHSVSRFFSFITLALSLTVLLSQLSQVCQAANPLLLNGAGATFPYPLYSKWFSDFSKVDPEVRINYQSIGSGGGIRQFLDQTVDFGATDSPMTDEQISKAKEGVLHIPTALGAVVITYQVPGLKTAIRLAPEVVAGIYLGEIKDWSDPKIAALNPGVNIPAKPILVVYRADGSGTTGVFTDYLSKVSATWKSKVGAGTAVKWPIGIGAKGNEGVTGMIKQSPGALGYVELVYAKSNQLPYAHIKNRAGNFTEPSVKTISEAAEAMVKSGAMPADFRVSITDPPGKTAYPISSFTYLLVSPKMAAPKGPKFVSFLKWAMKEGQASASALDYAPLPASLLTRVKARIQDIK